MADAFPVLLPGQSGQIYRYDLLQQGDIPVGAGLVAFIRFQGAKPVLIHVDESESMAQLLGSASVLEAARTQGATHVACHASSAALGRADEKSDLMARLRPPAGA